MDITSMGSVVFGEFDPNRPPVTKVLSIYLFCKMMKRGAGGVWGTFSS